MPEAENDRRPDGKQVVSISDRNLLGLGGTHVNELVTIV